MQHGHIGSTKNGKTAVVIVMPQSLATSKHSCGDFDNLEMDVGTNVLMIMHVNDISRLSFGISDNHEYYSFTSATANMLFISLLQPWSKQSTNHECTCPDNRQTQIAGS